MMFTIKAVSHFIRMAVVDANGKIALAFNAVSRRSVNIPYQIQAIHDHLFSIKDVAHDGFSVCQML